MVLPETTKRKHRWNVHLIIWRLCQFGLVAVVMGQIYLLRKAILNSSPFTSAVTNTLEIMESTSSSSNNNNTITVAYAISLVKCGDGQSNDAGLVDAALVLRHSIHQISKRNIHSGSIYDYKMYAIVHKQAINCSIVLQQAGFEIVIKDTPVQPYEIQGTFLRTHIHNEWCCGADEMIKLYAYSLPEPIIVHVDIDYLFLKPLDDLFDVLLYPSTSMKNQIARSRIVLERPDLGWPTSSSTTTIDAFITRDCKFFF